MSRALACSLVVMMLASSLPASDVAANECNIPNAADLAVNFHRVDSELYRGGRPAYREDVYMKFAAMGIRTVMNLEGGDQAKREKAVVERVNLKLLEQKKEPLRFVSYPINAYTEFMDAPSAQEITALFGEIQQAPKPIYLHCKHGRDRTGMVVLLYRLWRGESSFEDAYAEARYYHFSKWNFGLKRALERYRAAEALKSLGQPPATTSLGVCRPEKLAAAAAAAAATEKAPSPPSPKR